MQKISKTFRLSKKAIEELNVLLNLEKKQAETFGIPACSLTEIIERGIDTLYTMRTDDSASEPYLSHMTTLIKDAVNQSMSANDLAINSILYDLAVVKEILYMQMKVGAYPKETEVIRNALNKTSVYQPLIEEKINDQIK